MWPEFWKPVAVSAGVSCVWVCVCVCGDVLMIWNGAYLAPRFSLPKKGISTVCVVCYLIRTAGMPYDRSYPVPGLLRTVCPWSGQVKSSCGATHWNDVALCSSIELVYIWVRIVTLIKLEFSPDSKFQLRLCC